MLGLWQDKKKTLFSIRVTVVSIFLFATAITAVVAIGLQYYFSRTLATEAALGQYQQTGADTSTYLNAVDAGAAQAASILAGYPGLVEGNWVTAGARRVFAEALAQNPLFYAVYIGFDNGDFYELVNLNVSNSVRGQLNAAPQDRWVVIEVAGEGENRRRQFHYHDADFNLRVSRSEATDYNAAKRPWFVAATAGAVNRTDPYQFQHLQAPGQTYSTRVKSGNGVLAVDIALSSISDYLRQRRASAASEMFVYKASGEIIASSLAFESGDQMPASTPLALSDSQRAMITARPLLTVANEIDWPPHRFCRIRRTSGLRH
ncbi:MAG: hypothetical protein M0Q95_12460 [Porticoccaceae bacterium]|nr:hypothetical protein [Porticoccaceae bacterium]